MQIGEIDWSDKTILVAEDEEINFMFLSEALAKLKANVVRAVNGEEAVRIIRENKNIDLVLMDIKMPKMSGFEATKIIKEFSDVPIVVQTAFAMTSEKKQILAAGCDDYIAKPIKLDILISTMKKYLD